MKRFETDLTDKQWAIIEPFILQTRTKPCSIDMREVVNAILYVFKTGIKRHIIVDADGGYRGKVVKQFVHRKGLKLKVIKKARTDLRYCHAVG